MLLHSFRHVQGIGAARERSLWAANCRSWSDLLSGAFERERLRIPPGLLGSLTEAIRADMEAFERGDLDALASSLRQRDHWRLYRHFADRAVFCDIETTGTDPSSSLVTVVGLHAPGKGARVFIDGFNLDRFPEALARYGILVTFNGSSFDVPFLKRAFSDLRLPPAHIDLRWFCRELGLKGGLKQIEKNIGLARHEEVRGFSGAEAVVLWQRFILQNDPSALRLLVRYNTEDTVNLERLLLHCLNRMYERHAFLGLGALAEEASPPACWIDPYVLIEAARRDGGIS